MPAPDDVPETPRCDANEERADLERYDFFLSYAAKDAASRDAARELHGHLATRGLRVFFDEVSLLPGDSWLELIPEKLCRSQVVVVLVSRALHLSWYQGAEVARAIELARKGALRLIPLFLEGPPSATRTIFGLEHLVTMSAEEGLAVIASRLEELLTRPPLRQEEATSAPAGRRLRPLSARWQPRELMPLIGREALVSSVAEALTHAPLVTLFGVGGIGKTVLSYAVLAHAAAQFPDGTYAVSAAGARRAHDVLERIATGLGLPAPGGSIEEAAAALAAEVGGRRVLLLVDNFEDVLASDEELARQGLACLARDKRAPHLLLTSRRTVGLPGERSFLIPPLSPVNAATLMKRALTGRGVEIEEPALARLAVRLEGHPLAAELAAHRLVAEGLAAVEEGELASDVSGLLHHTWERLTPGTRALLGALSHLPAGAPWWLLKALGSAPEDTREATSWGLCQQLQNRLLSHALVRAFISATAEGRAAVPRLWSAYHTQIAAQVTRYDGGQQAAALTWFRSERANVDVLLGLMARVDAGAAASLFISVWRLYLWTGASAAGLRAYEELDEAAHAGDTALPAATMAYFLGEHEQAERLARLALSRLGSADAHQAHYILSTASRALGRLEVAEREMRRGLELCEQLGDERHHPNFLKELGVIADALGSPHEAVASLNRAIGEYQRQGDQVAEGFAVQCLGTVERNRGNRRAARELAQRSLEQGLGLDEPRVRGYARRDLATLALDEGRFQEAARFLDAARQDFLEADHRVALRWLDLERARLETADGRISSAWEALLALEKQLADEQCPEVMLAVRLQCVELLSLCDRRTEARAWLEPCRGAAQRLGQPRWILEVQTWQARLDAEAPLLQEVMEAWSRLGDTWAHARCRLALAELRGEREELSALFDEALEREDPRAELRIALRLAELDLARGEATRAAHWAKHAEARAEHHGTALERAEAALLSRRDALPWDDAEAAVLREASRTFLVHGQATLLATAWAALPSPTPREQEVVRFLRAESPAALLSARWEEATLKKLVERHSVLLFERSPGVLHRLLERMPMRPPGSDDLESLCERRLAQLVQRNLEAVARQGGAPSKLR